MDETIGHSARKNCSVYILGSESLLDEALSVCIAQELGARCLSICEPQKAKEDATVKDSEKRLFLINGSETDYETAISELQSGNGFADKVIFFALFNIPADSGVEKRAFEKGVRGFFYSGDKIKQLVKGLDALLRGDIWISRGVLADLAMQGRKKKGHIAREKKTLTEREMQVIALVSIGASNEEIAEKLCVSPYTIKTHLYNIFKKVGVPNRFQAALWAAKNL